MKVSVLIPIYNQQAYLKECLDSVVDQDYNDYEVILINDGSTDDSEKICQEYVTKHNCFQYIYQGNKGLGEARNTGLRHANGTYVLFLDSDDAIERNSIRKLVSFAEKNQADMVYFDEIFCDEEMSALYLGRTYAGMDTKITKLRALELSLHPAHICARLYRRKIFDNIRFASMWYEDMEIFSRLIVKAERLFYYKVPIYYYRQHKEGISQQKCDDRNLDVITAWNNTYTKGDYSDEEKRAVEICVKKSIYEFIFSKPQYAILYVEFYNNVFGNKMQTERREVTNISIEDIPLWQQADFYGQIQILDILKGLRDAYQYGGILRFDSEKIVDYQKVAVEEEEVIFSIGEDIILQEIGVQRGNSVILEVINILSQWNLISMKNQMKTLKITKNVMEKALLSGIHIKLMKC